MVSNADEDLDDETLLERLSLALSSWISRFVARGQDAYRRRQRRALVTSVSLAFATLVWTASVGFVRGGWAGAAVPLLGASALFVQLMLFVWWWKCLKVVRVEVDLRKLAEARPAPALLVEDRAHDRSELLEPERQVSKVSLGDGGPGVRPPLATGAEERGDQPCDVHPGVGDAENVSARGALRMHPNVASHDDLTAAAVGTVEGDSGLVGRHTADDTAPCTPGSSGAVGRHTSPLDPGVEGARRGRVARSSD